MTSPYAILIGAVLLALVGACDAVEDVRLQHPNTGEVVLCIGASGEAERSAQNECIEDFMAQGYQRIESSTRY